MVVSFFFLFNCFKSFFFSSFLTNIDAGSLEQQSPAAHWFTSSNSAKKVHVVIAPFSFRFSVGKC